MKCESTYNPNAYAAGNYGLFQINAVHGDLVPGGVEALYDPETNVRMAYGLWLAQGWKPWLACWP